MSASSAFRSLARSRLALLLCLFAAWCCPRAMHAGSPRFVTSASSSNPGAVVTWYSANLSYFTDPGNLSASVPHAQADSIVAAAAAVWNVPSASLVLARGGSLAEHVSSLNTYFDGNGVVFPSDVSVSNYQAIQIAVIYDSDGSITDLLLGQGASDPSSCRQNEVTESVDGFANDSITHAVLILNGRCTGSSQDQLMQLQYYVMRAFGRLLGVGWSQLNDNVFTGSPIPTGDQMNAWPIMHPIDVVCGPYTYLCMTNPFLLRDDDLSTLATLFPVTASNLTAGKVLSSSGAVDYTGYVAFPNGMPVDGVNVVAMRTRRGGPDDGYQDASAVSAFGASKNKGNPVTGPPSEADNTGSDDWNIGRLWEIKRLPLPSYDITEVFLENINPLYSAEYSLGPSQRPPVSLSGTNITQYLWQQATDVTAYVPIMQYDAPSACGDSQNGWEQNPTTMPASGWWSSVVCQGFPWRNVPVRAGHTWTAEITALDEAGGRTMSKLQPVIGVWNASGPTGQLPTVAAQPFPMNTLVPGLTQLNVPAANADAAYRFTMDDYYGEGRPDFAYTARLLYADTVSPAVLPATGGQITINGMGFATGNRVLVNGVVASVVSWSQTQIVALAPSVTGAKATGGTPVSVEVLDLTTGGSTTVSSAVSYPGSGTFSLTKISSPAALETAATSSTPFAVKVVASDGVTGVPGASVSFKVVSGGATLTACGLSTTCTLTANSAGVAQTAVTGISAGMVILSATELTGGVTVQVSIQDSDPVRRISTITNAVYLGAGASATLPIAVQAFQDGAPAANIPVNWGVSNGLSVNAGTTVTDSSGLAQLQVSTTSTPSGVANVQGCAWTSICTTWSVVSVDPSQWTPTVVSGAGQSVTSTATLSPVSLRVTDGAGHALIGATLTVSQTVTAWEGTCGGTGRCAAAPVLGSNQSTVATDNTGQVTLTPLQVGGVPQVVNMAIASGTTGFLTLTLVKTP